MFDFRGRSWEIIMVAEGSEDVTSATLKDTSNNSWLVSKRLKKPPSTLKIWQIDRLFVMIFALNLIF